MIRIETEDHTVDIDDSPETVRAVFDAVVDYYKRVGAWSGESVMQCDTPQIEAAPFLADLVDDVIHPITVWKS